MAKKKKKSNPKQNKHQQKKQQSNLPAILFFSISGVVIVAFLIFFAMNSDNNSTQNVANEEPLEYEFTYEGQPSIGDEDAPIKIAEFGDYSCSHCKDFHDVVYPEIKKDFIDTGKVQFFFINFPFIDDDSLNIAKGGEAVFAQNEDAFWEYHDLVYQQEQSEEQWATVDVLTQLVEENLPAVDAEQFKEDLENNAQISAVNEDLTIVKEAGITSTPTMFINGKEFKQWYDYKVVKEEIERLLESEGQ